MIADDQIQMFSYVSRIIVTILNFGWILMLMLGFIDEKLLYLKPKKYSQF
jgi:hypothetical protein